MLSKPQDDSEKGARARLLCSESLVQTRTLEDDRQPGGPRTLTLTHLTAAASASATATNSELEKGAAGYDMTPNTGGQQQHLNHQSTH